MSLLSFDCLLNRRYIIVDCKIVLSPQSLLLNLSERNKSLFTLSFVRHNCLLVRMSPRVLKKLSAEQTKNAEYNIRIFFINRISEEALQSTEYISPMTYVCDGCDRLVCHAYQPDQVCRLARIGQQFSQIRSKEQADQVCRLAR